MIALLVFLNEKTRKPRVRAIIAGGVEAFGGGTIGAFRKKKTQPELGRGYSPNCHFMRGCEAAPERSRVSRV
jgi:hypothetical protein